MANRKLETHVHEIGWPRFIAEIAELAREDADRYGPRNYQKLMQLSDELNRLSGKIRGSAPSFPGNYFKREL